MRAHSDIIFVNNDSAASILHPGLCAAISMSMYVMGKHARKSICHKWYRAHNDVLRLWPSPFGLREPARNGVRWAPFALPIIRFSITPVHNVMPCGAHNEPSAHSWERGATDQRPGLQIVHCDLLGSRF